MTSTSQKKLVWSFCAAVAETGIYFRSANVQCSLKLNSYIPLWLSIHHLKVKFIFLLQSNIFLLWQHYLLLRD